MLLEALMLFEGQIYQMPPLRCAVKRQLRVKTVYKLELIEKIGKYCIIRMHVEAGTYARKLIHDIGEVIGCGANMRELRRTRVGPWTEAETVTLNQIREACVLWKEFGHEDMLRKVIRPVEDMVKHLPKIWVRDSAVDAICHGAALAAPGVVKLTSNVEKGRLVALMTLKNELIALATAEMNANEILAAQKGIVARVQRVIMPRGSYPKLWKSAKQKEEVKFQ